MSQMMTREQRDAALKDCRSLFQRMRGELAKALGHHMDPDRFLRVALTSIQRTPKLLECSRGSLLGAVMQSAQLRLEPDNVLGHAHLVPFGDTVQFILGYKGVVELVLRGASEYAAVGAEVVYENDDFDYSLGTEQKIHHRPTDSEEPGPITHTYAWAKRKDGAYTFVVWPQHKVDGIRARSRAASKGPWVTDYEAMSRKTMLKQLSKWLRLNTETQYHLAQDSAREAGEIVDSGVLDDIGVAKSGDDDGGGGPTSGLDQLAGKGSKKRTKKARTKAAKKKAGGNHGGEPPSSGEEAAATVPEPGGEGTEGATNDPGGQQLPLGEGSSPPPGFQD